ncbi:MAG TPA: ribosome small subunit-dependent GTPase A [Abditibacteriaceae bacterium]|jgi:ribosome biogenesis GTPase
MAISEEEQLILNSAEAGTIAEGTVLRAGGGVYEVDVRGGAGASNSISGLNHEVFLCTPRGILKKGRRETSQPVAVGDRVRIRILETSGATLKGTRVREGSIEEILPRKSVLARSRHNKTAQVTMANLDQCVVAMALRDPDLNLHRLDRFLVLAEAAGLEALIVLNKTDLVPRRTLPKEIEEVRSLYEPLGYRVFAASAHKTDGIAALREAFAGHIIAFVGSSGVGKSSLVNAIQPGLRLYVGDVMEIGKGRHTTTDVSLHPLSGGGYLADTPGVKTVSLLAAQDLDLAQCFPEIRERSNGCKFNDCTHTREPGCAIRAAAESGEIAATRFASYEKIFAEIEALPPHLKWDTPFSFDGAF